MPGRRGPIKHDPHSLILPSRSRGPTGCNDAGDPNCHAELGDTPGSTGRMDHTAMMALQWHRLTQGQRQVSPISRPRPRFVISRERYWWEILGSDKPPKTIQAAPEIVKFSDAMMTQLKNLYMIMVNNPIQLGNSPTKKQCERSQRIAIYKDQTLKLAGNIEVMDDEEVRTPDDFIYLKGSGVLLDTDYEVIGAVHTHPRSDTFSGGDIASFINYTIANKTHMIYIVVCPTTLFMMVRTEKTYNIGGGPKAKEDEVHKRRDELVKKGASEKDAYLTGVKEAASKYGIALYECKKSSQNDDPFKRLN
jgi:hypothetical protein